MAFNLHGVIEKQSPSSTPQMLGVVSGTDTGVRRGRGRNLAAVRMLFIGEHARRIFRLTGLVGTGRSTVGQGFAKTRSMDGDSEHSSHQTSG